MNKNTGIVIGASVMVLTTLLYVLPGNACFDLAVYWIALITVLLLEFTGFMLLLFARGEPHRIAAAAGILLGAVITAGASVVCLLLFPHAVALFGIFAAGVLAVTGIQAWILWTCLWKNNAKNSEREDAGAFFDSCRTVVAALRALPEAGGCADGLRMLEDDLRYADDTRRTEQDGQIREMLTQLSNGLQEPGFDPTAIIADLRSLLRQRQKMLHP